MRLGLQSGVAVICDRQSVTTPSPHLHSLSHSPPPLPIPSPSPTHPQATKVALRSTLALVSSQQSVAFGMTQKKVEKRQQQLVQALGDEKASVDASMRALRDLTMETMKLQYAMLPSR